MTTLELIPLVETQDTDGDDDTNHLYCEDCYPNGERAFCGADVSGDEEIGPDEEINCEMCLMLDECPKCDW